MRPAIATASSRVLAMPDSGMRMPRDSMARRNWSRSSARSIAVTPVPSILHAGRFELARDVERGLAAELHDHALGLLLFVDREHVLDGERLEVQLVRGVVVGGHGLGVAVHHDGLVPEVAQGEGHVHAAVVELDALPDPVGAAAEDHHLSAVARRHPVGRVVRGVVVGGVLHARHRHRVPRLDHVRGRALSADALLVHPEDRGEVGVREPVALGLRKEIVGEIFTPVREDALLELPPVRPSAR